MKKCPQCDVEMKQINHTINLLHGGLIPHIEFGRMYVNDDRDLVINYFICPECGLVQQYLQKDKMKYLKDL